MPTKIIERHDAGQSPIQSDTLASNQGQEGTDLLLRADYGRIRVGEVIAFPL
jgi:hypothetical protein